MSAELRESWVCGDGCGLRVRHADGRPIPEPKKWEAGRCPLCRIERERQENGIQAANAMRDKVHGLRKRPSPFTHRTQPDKPKAKPKLKQIDSKQQEAVAAALRGTFDTDAGIAKRLGVSISEVTTIRDRENIPTSTERRARARRARVQAVLAEHPDWSTQEIADHLDLPLGPVNYDRQVLGLGRTAVSRSQSRKDTRRARIVAYVEDHPDATNQEIGDAIGISPRTVQKDRYALRVASESGASDGLDTAGSTATLARPES
jgi:hypothetical protein